MGQSARRSVFGRPNGARPYPSLPPPVPDGSRAGAARWTGRATPGTSRRVGGTGGNRLERDCSLGAMGMTMPVDRTQERGFRGECVAGLGLALPVIAVVAGWL